MDSALDQVLRLGGLTDSHAETWMWLALLLIIAEIFTSGFFLGVLALSAVVTAACAWLGMAAVWQLAAYSIVALAAMLWVRPVFVRWLAPDELRTNTAALVGESGTVVDQVLAGGHGRIRLANEEWRATSTENLDVGELVRVLEVRGNTLVVVRA